MHEHGSLVWFYNVGGNKKCLNLKCSQERRTWKRQRPHAVAAVPVRVVAQAVAAEAASSNSGNPSAHYLVE